MTVRRKLLSDLLRGIIDVPAESDCEISAVSFDSRTVTPGSLFLARNGIATHGLTFVAQAMQRGAAAVLWETAESITPPQLPEDIFAAALKDFSISAGEITAKFFDQPSDTLSVIGVTGTNGKTTVSHLVAQALELNGTGCGVIGTLGTGRPGKILPGELTTPEVLQLQQQLVNFMEAACNCVVMEVTSHALDQGRVSGVHFHTVVFTNITRDHLDYHENEGAYAVAKSRLFSTAGLQCAVINAEDPVGQEFIKLVRNVPMVVGYGIGALDTNSFDGIHILTAREIDYTELGLSFTAVFDGAEARVDVPLIGRFNVYNVLAVIGVLLGQEIPLETAVAVLQDVKQITGRMERFGGQSVPVVIVDYAHTPDALLQSLNAARAHTRGQLFCVFGCGGDRDRGKRTEMGRIAERLADHVVVTDDNPRTEQASEIVQEILAGMQQPDDASVIHDRASAIKTAIGHAKSDDVVLVAGKGHEEYQITAAGKKYFSDRDIVTRSLEEWVA